MYNVFCLYVRVDIYEFRATPYQRACIPLYTTGPSYFLYKVQRVYTDMFAGVVKIV